MNYVRGNTGHIAPQFPQDEWKIDQANLNCEDRKYNIITELHYNTCFGHLISTRCASNIKDISVNNSFNAVFDKETKTNGHKDQQNTRKKFKQVKLYIASDLVEYVSQAVTNKPDNKELG